MTRQGMLLRFVATVVLGITCVLLSLAWWPFLGIVVLAAAAWAIHEIRWANSMKRLFLTEEGRAAAGEAGAHSSKHDDDCMRRKRANPYLCTCGLTDAEVQRGLEKL